MFGTRLLPVYPVSNKVTQQLHRHFNETTISLTLITSKKMASTFRTTGRKIVAIGRNYADHAKELNNAIPKEPFFFLKPTTSYLDNGGTVEIPKGVDCHFEVELGVVIGKRGRDIKAEDASKYIGGYALAIDLTARNLQDQVKKQGLPWSAVKGFDTFCPISKFIEPSRIPDPQNVRLWLKTDDKLRQDGNSKDMIFPVSRLLQHVSSIMTVEEGDLLLTGEY
jgi:acylpyruvate hydrolase